MSVALGGVEAHCWRTFLAKFKGRSTLESCGSYGNAVCATTDIVDVVFRSQNALFGALFSPRPTDPSARLQRMKYSRSRHNSNECAVSRAFFEANRQT